MNTYNLYFVGGLGWQNCHSIIDHLEKNDGTSGRLDNGPNVLTLVKFARTLLSRLARESVPWI